MAGRARNNRSKKHPGDYLQGDPVECPRSDCDSQFDYLNSLSRHLVVNHKFPAYQAKKAIETVKQARSIQGKQFAFSLFHNLYVFFSLSVFPSLPVKTPVLI